MGRARPGGLRGRGLLDRACGIRRRCGADGPYGQYSFGRPDLVEPTVGWGSDSRRRARGREPSWGRRGRSPRRRQVLHAGALGTATRPADAGGPAKAGGSAKEAIDGAGATRPLGSRPSGVGSTNTGGAAAGTGASLGGAGGAGATNSALTKLVEHDASKYKWVAAVDGSQSAATLELATSGDAVMAIGGFNGEGGHLSLGAFEKYVADGDIHYYIGGSSGPGGGNSESAITAWVKAHFTSTTVGGERVYDLTSRTTR